MKKPEWIRKALFRNNQEDQVKILINKSKLHTVCEEAHCPNRGECYANQCATFLLLGNICTRNCGFCNIDTKTQALSLDQEEPYRIANAVEEMNLKYVVLTSVTRDDLSDGGASIYLKTIKQIKKLNREIQVEVLVPDFNGDTEIIEKVAQSDIVVFNHNLETVPSLYPNIRPQANYQLSLQVLGTAKKIRPDIKIKTGIMVGLGETESEIQQLMKDFKNT
ncbi:MAG: lipoyl synthase, partial [Spirochaetes bacterium]|nr:lipoyl synthase [Spirochaetota bacterium]